MFSLYKNEFITYLNSQMGEMRSKIVAGTIISGIAGGLITYILTQSVNSYPERVEIFFLSFVICISILTLAKRYALTKTVGIVVESVQRRNLEIIQKIRDSKLIEFEKMDASKFDLIGQSTEIIAEASRMIVNIVAAMFMLVVSFVYLGMISSSALFLSLILTFVSIFVYQSNMNKINLRLHSELELKSKYRNLANNIINGFKECKINRKKSDDIYREIDEISESIIEQKGITEKKSVDNIIFAQIYFFVLVGAMIFILPIFEYVDKKEMIAIVPLLLFVLGPIGSIVEAMPFVAKADILLSKIRDFESELDTICDETSKSTYEIVTLKDKISLKNIEFNYFDHKDIRSFGVGPIDLDINRGEVLFVVGGNGSGKTTFLKLLTNLYYPDSGEIRYDDNIVGAHNSNSYKSLFSPIFTDYHLFKKIYSDKDVDDLNVNELISKFGLQGKTTYRDREFENIDLSTGQRKRVALINAILENKDILIFDEVAADQDPEFRKYFYQEFLKELKDMGKTLIVVSHDDRYFSCADRVIKMEYGKIISVDKE